MLTRWQSTVGLAAVFACAVVRPACGQPVSDPEFVTAAGSGPGGLWTLRSDHLVWGMPRLTDNRHNVLFPGESEPRPGVSVLVREGFVVGHYDLFKVPAWVSVRWTREDLDRLRAGSFGRPFAPDEELPRYARADTDYDYSTSAMERGHMARHEDNEAWGSDNSDAGCLMSNIVPQHRDMNGEAWNDLEDLHQEVVGRTDLGIDAVWVISGPIFENSEPEFFVGNDIAVPAATFKVIGWFSGETFHARGYVVGQDDRVRNNPANYLTPIREIEQQTGLDFFPDLPAERADAIETVPHQEPWGGAESEDGPGVVAGVVLLHSLCPNPPGDESMHESVSVRNHGAVAINLDGWRLRDRSGRGWDLFGVIDPGDERTFLRNGQAMAMNNSGPESIELLRPDGVVADRVDYSGAGEGAVLLAENLR